LFYEPVFGVVLAAEAEALEPEGDEAGDDDDEEDEEGDSEADDDDPLVTQSLRAGVDAIFTIFGDFGNLRRKISFFSQETMLREKFCIIFKNVNF
jgi:hypothetical protein